MFDKNRFESFNVLFICAHNSARSILAEALLNRLGAGRFHAVSAGIDPVPAISPYALALLHKINYHTGDLKTKGLAYVTGEHAPMYNLVIRLSPDLPPCGRLPEFEGHPVIVDWFMGNPCEVMGSTAVVATAYADVFNTLANRIDNLSRMSDITLYGHHLQPILERMGEPYLRLAS
jgi:arsenate reductase (thioredoxin)